MAFGKDQGQLTRIPAFGGASMQQRARWHQNKTQGQRSGRGRRFSDEYKPPMDNIDTGRLILGKYTVKTPIDDKGESLIDMDLEYFPFVEHFDGRLKKSSVCSGGPLHNFKGKRSECRGCDIYYNGTEKKRMSKRDMFAFSFLHMAPYHKIESIDQSTGQIRMNTNKNEPYYDWVPCLGRLCTACRAGKETIHGRVRPWPMGFSHFNALIDLYGQNIARSCSSCGGRDTITSLAWVCTVEGCGEAIIDLSSSTLPDADIKKIVTNEVTCPHCRNTLFAQEVYACAACQNGRRASIFDVNIQVQRFATGKGENNQTQLVVSGWSNPCAIDPTYTEIAKALPLNRMYAPDSIEVQEKKFEIQGGTPVQNQGFRPYGLPQPGAPVQQQIPQGPSGIPPQQGPNYNQ